MSNRRGSWRADIQRTREQLEGLPARTVIVDEQGDAWQSGGYGFWYRAFDADGVSPLELAQRAGSVTVLPGAEVTA